MDLGIWGFRNYELFKLVAKNKLVNNKNKQFIQYHYTMN